MNYLNSGIVAQIFISYESHSFKRQSSRMDNLIVNYALNFNIVLMLKFIFVPFVSIALNLNALNDK
jgi:hypothetical protein